MGKGQGLPRGLSPTDFPNLKRGTYEVTSPADAVYNCIAHAAGEDGRCWDSVTFPHPGYHWPPGAERGDGLNALTSCFEAIGYEVCDHGETEDGFAKVALYVDPHGDWTHAARQTDGGDWTSKLGQNVDIQHGSLEAIGGPAYGTVACFMRRPD